MDLIEKKVFKVTDEFELPVPETSGDYDDEAVRGPYRSTLKPIEITQPEGPGFTLDGYALRWQDWSLRIGFDAREGLPLHQVGVAGRPVLYRASIPEMVVPYGDPEFRYWQAYFDTGEYLVGKWANSLERGCDCLGEIAYLDATVTDEAGQPRTIPNAICIHEEDFGILWKHTDIFNGSAQSRRQRRLVVSYFTTVGNYDYGFYWYFYLDGTIELEVKATGVLFTSAYPGADHPYSTEVAPGLAGAVHQHLFSARLDMTVDGLANAVEEVDVSGLPIGPANPYGNASPCTTRPRGRLAAAAGRRMGRPRPDLSDSCTEFGTINSGFGGRPYRYNYAATNEPGWFLFNGLVKHDTLTGREERYQFEPGVFCSEVGVAPRVGGTGEDDAYLVTLTVDMNRDLSECVVFRANDVGRGPIARAQLPERIASGTHSCWAPGESLRGW